jgi:hypothetical protein
VARASFALGAVLAALVGLSVVSLSDCTSIARPALYSFGRDSQPKGKP